MSILLPTYSTHLCLLHTFFLTTEVFSTLHHTGFEAHDILRSHHHLEISQMPVDRPSPMGTGEPPDEQDDGKKWLGASDLVFLTYLF